jgi:hypothetical protein
MSDSTRRFEDQFEHQQNLPSNSDRQHANTAWGSGDNAPHSTVTGATGDAIQHALGRHQDPTFRPDHTVDPQSTTRPVSRKREDGAVGVGEGPQILSTSNQLETLCGPLLNYRYMSGQSTDNPSWHGSVLIVTTPGQRQPQLVVRGTAIDYTRQIDGVKLYEDPKSAFWRFDIQVPFLPQESRWDYEIPGAKYVDSKKTANPGSKSFYIPSKTQSMRIMFHSCNGFSVGTDTDAWSGCALWNDVLRMHEQKPFHVMIGGGDQIYNDGVRVDGPLRPWTDIGSPHKRRHFPFNEELRAKCDEYYFNNYVNWYGTEPFSFANAQIPQLNIWDDHDIIDGFGSYTDHFMRCAVFRGIGGIAHKYYLLFQHHLAPPKSTFTTDAPQTVHANEHGTAAPDAVQLSDTFVKTGDEHEPSYIIGSKPGPYVEERSRSMYCQLGARIAFVGIDARTERTRHQINYPETYDQIFQRTSAELQANPAIKHLILLLGVPIAYPRLQWLENILQSPIIGPLRFLNKRFGVAGEFFNQFDGQVDLLDDLDDHYTAHQHKSERRELVQRLQDLAKRHGVRISILGGDVHLAALGRFYSNPKLNIPVEQDWRYMANIVSSAITNKPPPSAVANLLASRNKIHHLDHDTDETLLNLFDKDPGHEREDVKNKTKDKNHCTMPSRNYAIIAESHNGVGSSVGAAVDAATNGYTDGRTDSHTNGHTNGASTLTATTFPAGGNPRNALHAGEQQAGTTHPAAGGLQNTGLGGPDGLDVCIKVEISPSDREGHTLGYGFSIPGLNAGAYKSQGTTW